MQSPAAAASQGAMTYGGAEAAAGMSEPSHGRVRLFGRIMRGLDTLQAVELHRQANPDQQARMLSAAGASVGAFWSAVPTDDAQRLTNAQWNMALRLYLGHGFAFPPDVRCQLTTQDGEVCMKPLDDTLKHVTVCMNGPAKTRAHRALMTVLRRALEKSGAAVDEERVVPEWYKMQRDGSIKEARLDLVVHYPGSSAVERIDVTVFSPFSAVHQRGESASSASIRPGAAAKVAEKSKHVRYGPDVAPLAFESFGRLGQEGHALLARLRRAALDYGKRKPGGGRPVGLNLRRLRLHMESALFREVADAALLALGCKASLALGWQAAQGAAAASRRT